MSEKRRPKKDEFQDGDSLSGCKSGPDDIKK
jgi:hypothetical protein